MENVNPVFSFVGRLTETEKKQADVIAGGNFEKLLAEFELMQTIYGKKNWASNSGNPFENSRANGIRKIFILQQKMREKNELALFDTDATFDLKKLRRDPAASFMRPGFLEKRFKPFGPTIISKFI
mgnify:FL=1